MLGRKIAACYAVVGKSGIAPNAWSDSSLADSQIARIGPSDRQ